MKGEKSAKKPKYEKPKLIPFNLDYELGLCNAGLAHPSGPCRNGSQASDGRCRNGSVPGRRCMAEATK